MMAQAVPVRVTNKWSFTPGVTLALLSDEKGDSEMRPIHLKKTLARRPSEGCTTGHRLKLHLSPQMMSIVLHNSP